MTPLISVVMAYYNRKPLLLETLRSISASKQIDNVEVIIVDDGSSEEHRLEDLVGKYPFEIKVIRQEPEDKWYLNPCVPFNMGIKEARGKFLVIQNPECFHLGDVLQFATTIPDHMYYTHHAYSLTKEATALVPYIDPAKFVEAGQSAESNWLPFPLNEVGMNIEGGDGYYNHVTHRPLGYHFCAVTHRKNMVALGGFDERYALGVGFDDNELITRVQRMGLHAVFVKYPLVLHQNHYSGEPIDVFRYQKNHKLFNDVTLRETSWKANQETTSPKKEENTEEVFPISDPKVVGFTQLHNELEQGNLENWFRSMFQICDCIYIYDQGSTDGSREIYETYDNVHVIYSETNDFINEITCKAKLLKKAKEEQSDADWFFWMDGDTLVEGQLTRPILNQYLANVGEDGVKFGHLNLWRSDTWTRLDDGFHGLHTNGVLCMWRNKEDLAFPEQEGLHHAQHPLQVYTSTRAPYSLIHRGFATDESIIRKYNTYKERGQTGWALERLLNEETLKVTKVEGFLPDWFVPDEKNPTTKKKLREIYDG